MSEVYINKIGTAVPKNKVSQKQIGHFMSKYMHLDDQAQRKLQAAFRMSGIKYRHSVIRDYAIDTVDDFKFYPQNDKLSPFPSTSKRGHLFAKEALELAKNAILDLQISEEELQTTTHLITVSCTGMYAPGIDIELIQELNLNTRVERTGIHFMGCYAAFNGIKTAKQIIKSDPSAKVLVVCLEMCSIHFQQTATDDHILANTLFADGAAALWMTSHVTEKSLKLLNQFCDLLPEGKQDMAWEIGDFGFEMKLSGYIPRLLEEGISKLSKYLFEHLDLHQRPDFFAIHPGGKRILESMKKALQLEKEDLSYAYEVLENYGNMSSPTVLFVLKEIWKQNPNASENQKIIAMAFGPGLTLESMSFSFSN